MHDTPTISMEGTIDMRPLLEFEVPYRRVDLTWCSVCGWTGVLRRDTTVVKHRHQRNTDGHLITRCPEHEAKRVADKERTSRVLRQGAPA